MDLKQHLTTADNNLQGKQSYGSMADFEQKSNTFDDPDTSSDDEDPKNGIGQRGTRFKITLPVGVKASDAEKGAFTPRANQASGSQVHTVDNHEGYCLVFNRVTKYHEVHVVGDKLCVEVRKGLDSGDQEKAAELLQKIPRRGNLLKHFKSRGLFFKIIKSSESNIDNINDYIYVVFSMSHDIAEQFADHKDLDVQIEARKAIEIGRKSDDFLLAQRTYLDGVDQSNEFKPNGSDVGYSKLDWSLWEHIHVSYDSSIDENVYRRHKKGHLLDNRLFLRVLYEYLVEDYKMGGVGFNTTKYLRLKNHPLIGIFGINLIDDDGVTTRPTLTLDEKRFPQKDTVWWDKINSVRSYYGELIAFYFAFLRHYTTWLYSIAIVGTVFFCLQLGFGKIAIYGIEVLVLFSIIWSTAMIENWYRRENRLKYEWGMMSYQDNAVPRPGFHGKVQVSAGTGILVETYQNYWLYYGKIIFSTSTMGLCIFGVLAIVYEIWLLKKLWGDSTELSIAVGMINSLQIQITNQLYIRLALILNEFEGHRLEQDYYNHLVIKKIVFFVVNSFNSLFYLAFYKGGYNSDEACLVSVRTQLLTLFLTAIFYQNTMEVLMPKIVGKIKDYFAQKKQEEAQNNAGGDQINAETQYQDTKHETIFTEDEDQQPQGTRLNSDAASHYSLNVTDRMMADIEDQIGRPISPDVLMNTSEIVIQYGYIMLFSFVFPAMPLLALINNFFEVRVDLYNLIESRRPPPFGASGIGVWKHVLSIFGTIAVFTNMALITFKTDIIENYLGSKNETYLVEFFFIACFVLLFCMFVVRFTINDSSQATLDAIERQEQCNRYLLINSIKQTARQQKKQE